VSMRIRGTPGGYYLSYDLNGTTLVSDTNNDDATVYVAVDTLMRPPPFGGMFTGMAFGIFGFGKGGPCLEQTLMASK
jgi:hypothetical protein